MALSYLTPGLSRRIQKQLLAQLPPSEAKKLTRTMSMRNSRERTPIEDTISTINSVNPINAINSTSDSRKNVSTLPRRYSIESNNRDFSLPRTKYSKPGTISEEFYNSNLPKPNLNLNNNNLLKCNEDDGEKTKIPSTLPRKSRFLRPDFYDKPKDINDITIIKDKEKKEREMETQKVLKEIRDKRKSRLNLRRERSLSRDTSKSESIEDNDSKNIQNNQSNNNKEIKINNEINNISGTIPKLNNNSKLLKPKSLDNDDTIEKLSSSIQTQPEDTNCILNNISDSIKTIETNLNSNQHDYVNIPPINVEENENIIVPKKDIKISKLIRPKSYPTDTLKNLSSNEKSKIAKPKKSEIKNEFKQNECKQEVAKQELAEKCQIKSPEIKEEIKKETIQELKKQDLKEIKNKSPPKTNGEKSNKNRFLQSIEKKIEKLRGLNANNGSRENSVEKKLLKEEKEKKSNIETAIKKLREQSLPRTIDHCITESGLIKRAVSVEDVPKCTGNKPLEPSRKSVTKILGLFKKYEEKDKDKSGKSKLKKPKDINNLKIDKNGDCSNKNACKDLKVDKEERPKSFYEPPLAKIDETKIKTSKLPVNSFRRSLNLENKLENKSKTSNANKQIEENGNFNNDLNDNFHLHKPDRTNLKLDLSKTTEIPDPIPSTSSENNRNSTATDDSSLFLSPCDDNVSCCDSWSICSDYHTHDLTSPISINGNIYSGDESGESVIDRIRRKSFYTRFNEKKKTPSRKPSITGSYRDLDLYKDYNNQRKNGSGGGFYIRSPGDYSSLDRRSVDYRFPTTERRLSYGSSQDSSSSPVKKEYRPYTRSSSLFNNDYVNVPHRYQTYNPRLTKHISSLYSPDTEDDAVDDLISTGKTRLGSYHYQPSRLNGRASSISPSIDKL